MLPDSDRLLADMVLATTLPLGTMTLVTTLPLASTTIFCGIPTLKPPRELNDSADMCYPKIYFYNIFILVS